jgi:hypothetical protein
LPQVKGGQQAHQQDPPCPFLLPPTGEGRGGDWPILPIESKVIIVVVVIFVLVVSTCCA